MEKTPLGNTRYKPQLDGLRALAVLAVLYTHYLAKEYWLFDVYWGGMGVRLFFVLSGFLITGILLREKQEIQKNKIPKFYFIRRFYLRRFLRLTPVFFLTLGIAAILNIPETRDTIWWHVFYLSNFNFAINDSWQGDVAHFWTLAVEEQFYLVWPLFILFVSNRILVWAIYLMLPLVILYRLIMSMAGAPEIAIWVLLPNSLDALSLGALLAVLVRRNEFSSLNRLPVIAAIAGLTIWIAGRLFEFPPAYKMFGVGKSALVICFTWLVLYAAEGHRGILGRLLEIPLITYLGKISYGIYVIHGFVPYVLENQVPAHHYIKTLDPVVFASICTVITIGLASLSWHFFEKPINRYRHSIMYQPGNM